ncbi:hypothetical protein BDP55DRAFT_629561 [Colletotrichum godetiae]|uniref:Uncharacterized protein n=1 Tax=Colletotrichum godetiae TaxID=1209918 RepID=A0AAJ0F0G6_9PEZI|nr:uncharacterized protein BDP55DRAFT_629561 [Colletotrichum godetiae]KAK1688452.1 hypothetical protein BDP55DRAFT_629561 [Colletotrichum godetiae]
MGKGGLGKPQTHGRQTNKVEGGMGRHGKAPSSLPHRHFGIQGWARLDPDSGLCASLAAAADYSSRLSHHLTSFPGFYTTSAVSQLTVDGRSDHLAATLSPFPSSPPPPLSSLGGLEKHEDESWELKLTLGWQGKDGKLPAEPPPRIQLGMYPYTTCLAPYRASCIDGRAMKKANKEEQDCERFGVGTAFDQPDRRLYQACRRHSLVVHGMAALPCHLQHSGGGSGGASCQTAQCLLGGLLVQPTSRYGHERED